LFPETVRKIKELGISPLMIGTGVIPAEDQEQLLNNGLDVVFGPGTPPQKIVEAIKEWENTTH
jgi:methylmalonyl-CoA mutase C-terminal domain/subunit